MSEDKSEDSSKEKEEGSAEEENLHDVLSGEGALRTPLFWGALIFIPIALTLFVSVRNAPQENQAVEVVEQAQSRIVWEGSRSVPKTRQSSHKAGFKNSAPPHEGCNFDTLIGLPVNEKIEEKVKALGRPYRVLTPGSMMTMDHIPERVNFDVDDSGVITRVWCG